MAFVTKNVPSDAGRVKFTDLGMDLDKRVAKWYRSDVINFDGATTNTAFRLPGNALIVSGVVEVETAFDASGTAAAATGTVTVNGVTLYDASTIGLQTAGYQPCTSTFPMVTPATGTTALVLQDPGTTTAGAFRIYLEIVQLDNFL